MREDSQYGINSSQIERYDYFSLLEEGNAERSTIKEAKVSRETYVIGDIHGNLDGLRDQLALCGVIDGGDRWIGGEKRVVLMGDLVDRGPESISVLQLVISLNRQARDAGGKLISLLGNHELFWLQRHIEMFGLRDNKGFSGMEMRCLMAEKMAKTGATTDAAEGQMVEQMRNLLKQCIADGVIQLAYTEGNQLMVHGGLIEDTKNSIISRGAADAGGNFEVNRAVDFLNLQLKNALTSDNFNGNPYFCGYTGVVWPRFKGKDGLELWVGRARLRHQEANGVEQIVGHTILHPSRQIFVNAEQSIIGADISLHDTEHRGVLHLAPGDKTKGGFIESITVNSKATRNFKELKSRSDLYNSQILLANIKGDIIKFLEKTKRAAPAISYGNLHLTVSEVSLVCRFLQLAEKKMVACYYLLEPDDNDYAAVGETIQQLRGTFELLLKFLESGGKNGKFDWDEVWDSVGMLYDL